MYRQREDFVILHSVFLLSVHDYYRLVDIRIACVIDRPCCSDSLNVAFSKTAEKIAESMKV